LVDCRRGLVEDRWTPDALAAAMDALPRTVEVNSQMTALIKAMQS
jgi:hypothetical protein